MSVRECYDCFFFYCAECNAFTSTVLGMWTWLPTATVASMAVPVKNVIDSLVVILIRMSSVNNVA
jgi:hypothetical protein